MNVKSIYETLAALGTSAMIAGCGASETPVKTAEQPLPESSTASTTDNSTSKETEAPKATSLLASTDQKPTTTNAGAPSSTTSTSTAVAPAPTTTAPAPAKTTKPVAAKATPVKKKAGTTPGKTAVKKDASKDCGEGGCPS